MLAAAAQALLVTSLVSAGLAKLVGRDDFLRALAPLPWLPLPLVRAASGAIPALELAVAALLVAVPEVGAWAALVLLLAFSAVIARELSAGRAFHCGCFGGAGARTVGSSSLLRNALLVAAAVAVLVIPYSFASAAALAGLGLGLLLLLAEVGGEVLALGRQA